MSRIHRYEQRVISLQSELVAQELGDEFQMV
jgi:hypothetical protein